MKCIHTVALKVSDLMPLLRSPLEHSFGHDLMLHPGTHETSPIRNDQDLWTTKEKLDRRKDTSCSSQLDDTQTGWWKIDCNLAQKLNQNALLPSVPFINSRLVFSDSTISADDPAPISLLRGTIEDLHDESFTAMLMAVSHGQEVQ
jgi:hypothetical protein